MLSHPKNFLKAFFVKKGKEIPFSVSNTAIKDSAAVNVVLFGFFGNPIDIGMVQSILVTLLAEKMYVHIGRGELQRES